MKHHQSPRCKFQLKNEIHIHCYYVHAKIKKIINNARKRGSTPAGQSGEITKLVHIVLIIRQAGLDGLIIFKK